MPEAQTQHYLFRLIRDKLSDEQSISDVVGNLLYVSNDSAYRRIRGETLLVLDEARILCEAFDISLDQILNAKPNSVLFKPFILNNDKYNIENFLIDIKKNLLFITSCSQTQLICLTRDIPFFHDFAFRPLFAFHYFFWMKSVTQHPDFSALQFCTDIKFDSIETLGYEIQKLYTQIPSTEIISKDCIDSTISHIEYYRQAGYFKSEQDVHRVYSALRENIEHLQQQAEHGCKFLPGESATLKKNNFEIFYNHLTNADNTFLVFLNGKKTVYLNYDSLNYMSTHDENFCTGVNANIQSLMKRATLISN
ncbi:MAG: hypothetical protein M3040_06980, partial [Bacteroidota bacterium]|nr:hypothetical protein [Bacteroidota bacterium]